MTIFVVIASIAVVLGLLALWVWHAPKGCPTERDTHPVQRLGYRGYYTVWVHDDDNTDCWIFSHTPEEYQTKRQRTSWWYR